MDRYQEASPLEVLIPLHLVLVLLQLLEGKMLALLEGNWVEKPVDSLRVVVRCLQHRRGDDLGKYQPSFANQ
ncbi:MAG: hypothetical protein AB8B39_07770 [Prochlorococcus sp.]